jgi:hypothetical protein
MPLIDLKTDLKSLKYGLDRRGLGSSKEPFITKAIPEGETPGASRDVLLRQGSIVSSVNDTSRLVKLFTTTRGLSFIANQNILSRGSVKTEATSGPAYVGGNINQGVYLPTSTLAQAGVGFTGTHLNLLGLDPSSPAAGVVEGGLFPAGGLIRYEQAAFDFNKEGLNRLVKLKEDKIDLNPNDTELLSYGGGPGSVLGIGQTRIKRTSNTTGINPYGNPDGGFKSVSFNKVNNSKSSLNLGNSLGASYEYFTYSEISGLKIPDLDDELLGVNTVDGTQLNRFGPQENNKTLSTLEDSKYLIATAKDTPGVKVSQAKTYFNDNSPSGSISDVFYGAGSDSSLASPNDISASILTAGIREAQAKTYFLDNSPEGEPLTTYGVTSKNKVVTLKSAYTKGDNASLKQKGSANPNYVTSSYEAGDDIANDKFNKAKSKLLNTSTSNNKPDSDQLFKFYLNFIDPDNPGANNYLYWQAYVDNFNDQIGAEYDSYNYVGRGYPLFKYKGFSRKIGLDFTIAANSSDEIIPIYQKLNTLIQRLAPNYSNEGYLRGSFVRLTFGDYFNNVPCILDGFSISPIFDAGFDITEGQQLAKAIKVSGFNFTPIADNNNQVITNNSSFISI